MLWSGRTVGPNRRTSRGPLGRLGTEALALGSGYQRNREAVEPVLRVGIDLLDLLVLFARQRPHPTPTTVSLLPANERGGAQVLTSGATR